MKKTGSQTDEIQSELRNNRKRRGEEAMEDLQTTFDRLHEPIELRVAEGLERVGAKCIDDVVEQYDAVLAMQESKEILAPAYVDAEVARLLRMMEKRKQFFEVMEAKAVMDTELVQLLTSCGVLFKEGNDRRTAPAMTH